MWELGARSSWGGHSSHGSLCALLLSTGFTGSFIAGRPFPVLCQLFLQEPCSASLPALAMGHVPLPVTWGVKQSSCEKGREGRAGKESWEQRQAAVPSPLLCFAARFPAWVQLGMFAKLKNSWSGLVVISVCSVCGTSHPGLCFSFIFFYEEQ